LQVSSGTTQRSGLSSGDESPSVIQIEWFAHTQFYIAFARYVEEVGLRASFRYELQQSQQIEFGKLIVYAPEQK
jgi:hypothetical protein